MSRYISKKTCIVRAPEESGTFILNCETDSVTTPNTGDDTDELANELMIYVTTNKIRAVLFDWDLTASSVHMGGFGAYIYTGDNDARIAAKTAYVQHHAGLLTYGFISSVKLLLSKGIQVGITTVSDAINNIDTMMNDSLIDNITTFS